MRCNQNVSLIPEDIYAWRKTRVCLHHNNLHDQTYFFFKNLASRRSGCDDSIVSTRDYPLIVRTNAALLRVQITDNACLCAICVEIHRILR